MSTVYAPVLCSEFGEQQERERQHVVERLLKEESNASLKRELYPDLFRTRKSEEASVRLQAT